MSVRVCWFRVIFGGVAPVVLFCGWVVVMRLLFVPYFGMLTLVTAVAECVYFAALEFLALVILHCHYVHTDGEHGARFL